MTTLVERIVRGAVARRFVAERIYERLNALESANLPARRYSRRAGERVLDVLRLLAPRDPVDAPLVRLGRNVDGGYVLVESLLTGGTAYSIGIGDDVSWDLAMAGRGYKVLAFDHTIDQLPQTHPSLLFTKVGLCASGERSEDLRSLDTILADNDHLAMRNLVLKMDIEGAEWDVLSTIPKGALACFSQLVIEFHNLDAVDDDALFGKMMRSLRVLGGEFVPVHVHGNNCSEMAVVGGVPVPPLVEMTYVRNDLVRTAPCARTFPTDIDRPNDPDRADLYLGNFQFPASSG